MRETTSTWRGDLTVSVQSGTLTEEAAPGGPCESVSTARPPTSETDEETE